NSSEQDNSEILAGSDSDLDTEIYTNSDNSTSDSDDPTSDPGDITTHSDDSTADSNEKKEDRKRRKKKYHKRKEQNFSTGNMKDLFLKHSISIMKMQE
ncbi:unnamed protein product, partial [Rotaria sordida]